MNKRLLKGFINSKKKADVYLKDTDKTKELINRAVEKADKSQGRLSKTWDDLQTLIRFMKAWIAGDYRQVSTKTMLTIIAAIIYFVNPLDIVPDFIIISGYIDDITIIGYVIKSILEDIDNFRQWEKDMTPKNID